MWLRITIERLDFAQRTFSSGADKNASFLDTVCFLNYASRTPILAHPLGGGWGRLTCTQSLG